MITMTHLYQRLYVVDRFVASAHCPSSSPMSYRSSCFFASTVPLFFVTHVVRARRCFRLKDLLLQHFREEILVYREHQTLLTWIIAGYYYYY